MATAERETGQLALLAEPRPSETPEGQALVRARRERGELAAVREYLAGQEQETKEEDETARAEGWRKWMERLQAAQPRG